MGGKSCSDAHQSPGTLSRQVGTIRFLFLFPSSPLARAFKATASTFLATCRSTLPTCMASTLSAAASFTAADAHDVAGRYATPKQPVSTPKEAKWKGRKAEVQF